MTNGFGLHDRSAIFRLCESGVARFPEPIGDHVHRLLEIQMLPYARIWAAIFNFHLAARMRHQLETVCALWTKMSARNGRLGIAFDADELAIFVKCQLPATYAAIRTNGSRHLCPYGFRPEIARVLAHCLRASTVGAGSNLPQQRPIGEEILQHENVPRRED